MKTFYKIHPNWKGSIPTVGQLNDPPRKVALRSGFRNLFFIRSLLSNLHRDVFVEFDFTKVNTVRSPTFEICTIVVKRLGKTRNCIVG